MNLTVEIDQEGDGRFLGQVPELPGVRAYGETREQAFGNVVALAYRTLAEQLLHGERSAESLMRVTVDGPTPDKAAEAVMGLSPSGGAAGDPGEPPRVRDVLVEHINLTAEQVSEWAARHACGLTAEERRLGEAFLVWHRTGRPPEEFRELFAAGPYDERIGRARAIASRLVPFGPHPDDMEEIRLACEAFDRGEGIELTIEQVRKWSETGELPWLESPSSSHDS